MKRFIVIIMCISIFTSCMPNSNSNQGHTNRTIQFAPYALSEMAYLDGKYYMLIQGLLHSFDEETLELTLVCDVLGCTHQYPDEYGKKTCLAAYPPLSSIGVYNDNLYITWSKVYGPQQAIDEIDLETMQYREIFTFKDPGLQGYSTFYDGYMYYSTDYTSLPAFSAGIKRVSLDNPAEIPETFFEVKGDSISSVYIPHIHFYDNYMVISATPGGQFVYVIDIDSGNIIYQKEGITHAAYNNQNLIYINHQTESIEFFDLQSMSAEKSFEIDEYDSNLNVACDENYIYLNSSRCNPYTPESHKIYIYDYDGNLKDIIPLQTVEDSISTAYLCTTENYIYYGNAFHPQVSSKTYVISKEQIGNISDTMEHICLKQ